MRYPIAILTTVTVLILSAWGLALAAPQQNTTAAQTMSAVDSEKACDAYRAQKDYEQAVKCFQEAIRKEPKNARLHNKLGLAELAAGDYDAARTAFTRATRCDRNYPEAWNDLGVVSFVEKNYAAAIRYFNQAIKLNETRANFHVNLGVTYFTMAQTDQAMVQYTRALELDPEALSRSSNAGMSAQLATREERAKLDFMMAKIYANMGNLESCLLSLSKAKEDGYASMMDVYKDECFSEVRKDPRLAEIVPPPPLK